MKKILFITLFPIESNNSSMITNLAILKGLCELNYDVTVISPYSIKGNMYHDQSLKLNNNFKRIYIGYENKNATKGNTYSKKTSILRKLWYKFSFFDKSILLLKYANKIQIDSTFDTVISFSDPKSSHLFAKKILKRIQYKKWIQLWGDPMTLDITKTVVWPNCITKIIEKNIIKKADKIIYVSPFTCNEQKKLYPDISSKMNFIPLPYIEEKMFELNNTHTIGYFGDYTSTIRNIKPLYDAINESEYKMVIAGSSNIKLNSTLNVDVLGRITQGEINNYLKEIDILVAVCNLSGTQIPGKIYYDSATNKPILIILDGKLKDEIHSFFKQYNRFYFSENNSKSIIDTINKIYLENIEFTPCTKFNYKEITMEIMRE